VLLDALADVDCNVIATVGPRSDPAELAPIPENAQQCVAIGAGKLLLPHELTAQAAREAVVSLLDDGPHKESARLVAREISAMPDPTALVPKLVATALQSR
jgi:UDP:flavonoid glycosyltransferase YjiC (YdhE family)